jgi:predicted metal-dependent hydrolase
MIYRLDNEDYEVEILKKGNKNTYVRVKENLTIQVTTNHFATKHDIKNLLDRNQDFLRKTLGKREIEKQKDDDFYFLGKKFDIVVVPILKGVELDGNKLYTPDKSLLEKWLKKQTLSIFEERLKYNYNLFEEDIPYPHLRIRSMKTRWGVCNRKNLIVTINSKLIRESIDKIDYVIIHELSHLVHFNHSRNFWEVVEKYCPKYKRIRKDLRE